MYLHQELQVHTLLPNQGKSITFEDIVNSVSTQVRSIIADYAVILTLVIFVTFDHAFNLATPKLTVPTELKVQTLSSVSSSMKNLHATFSSQLGQTCATGGFP